MRQEQADRMERKLNALCKATGGPFIAKAGLSLSLPGGTDASAAGRKITAIRRYAETLAASAVPSDQSHAATLLDILDGEP